MVEKILGYILTIKMANVIVTNIEQFGIEMKGKVAQGQKARKTCKIKISKFKTPGWSCNHVDLPIVIIFI